MKVARFAGLAVLFFFLAFAGTILAEKTDDGNAPSAFYPESTYKFGTVLDGGEVTHDFTIENKGDAPLEVQNVVTG